MRKFLILGISILCVPLSTYAQTASAVVATATLPRVAHIPILIYHSVRPYYPGITKLVKEYTVPPDIFDDQMKYLKDNGFTVVTLNDLWAYFQNGTPLPARPVMVTLDDGWENQYMYAYPILKKYHYVGIFYVYPGAINKKHFLTWTEIKDMASAHMAIEDHTQTHPELPKITDLAALTTEVSGSKHSIETNLGVPVTDFAYPFGEYNAQDIQAVMQAGYRTARTVHTGTTEDSSAPYTLDGIIITGDFNRFVSLVNK